jgi:hypothetical protein
VALVGAAVKPRHAHRLADKVRDNARRCGVALTEWVALPRTARKKLLSAAKKKGPRRG